MLSITQGTVISGVRSEKYKGINCCAIVINARCDLAQGKANKIYYLIAMSLEEWVFSSIGFSTTFNSKINDIGKKIKQKIESEGLSWEDLQDFSPVDFNKVIESTSFKGKEKDSVKVEFLQFSHLRSDKLSIEEKREIMKNNKKLVNNFFAEMSNGKNSNYLILPSTALKEVVVDSSIIVDLKELDYLDLKQKDALLKYDIDNKNIRLSEDEKNVFNEKYFVLDPPGYAMVVDEVDSPWIEYIVQHFANAFTRVGVDNLSKEQIEETINTISDN